MNRQEFSSFVENALEETVQCAENLTGKSLPRKIAFCWLQDWQAHAEPIRSEIAEAITNRVYEDEQHIWPCVDLGVADLLPDGTLVIIANVAGYKPRPFQRNWTGREGPFVYIVGQSLLDRLAGRAVDPSKTFRFSIPGMRSKMPG
ncbi:MAG TPA: hypothetical protein VEJ46_14415 [Candidatus Acidoferrum sp.]|nr:hypothetical protein [Candidatus Acidoferrum sp.]